MELIPIEDLERWPVKVIAFLFDPTWLSNQSLQHPFSFKKNVAISYIWHKIC